MTAATNFEFGAQIDYKE